MLLPCLTLAAFSSQVRALAAFSSQVRARVLNMFGYLYEQALFAFRPRLCSATSVKTRDAAGAAPGGARGTASSATAGGAPECVSSVAGLALSGAAGAAPGKAAPGAASQKSRCAGRKFASYNMKEHYAFGEQCVEFRRVWELRHGTRQGWVQAFLAEFFGEETPAPEVARATYTEVRAAVALVGSREKVLGGRKGSRRAAHTSRLRLQLRKRNDGGGRKPVCPALSDELWAWFVDHIANVPGRVNSNTILGWANVLCHDMRELWQKRVEVGDADPAVPPALPKLNRVFVMRWRKAYGISWRTVNLRYKISAKKRKHRIRIFWCNVLRLRILHERFFGPGKLRFVGFDQKPLYFNSSAAKKTLARAGARKVAVKENLAASRERFTVMTSVPSWTPEESSFGWTSRYGDIAPQIAVLFKSATASARRIRAKLTPPADCLLQFAEKGSYRLAGVIAFLEWFLKSDLSDEVDAAAAGAAAGDAAGVAARAAAGVAAGAAAVRKGWDRCMQPDGSNTVVVVLDWFAPHLDGAVDNLLHTYNASILRIGGGITGDVQVGDTHRHGPYTAAYRLIETAEDNDQLYLRPWKLPECSRQMVLDRSVNAWSQCPHLQCEHEWKQDGMLNALDGSEDLKLADDLRPLWRELQMKEWRDQISHDIDVEISNGNLTSWWQYPDLLESYDEHSGLREGEELAEVDVVGADDDDDDDDDDGGGSEEEPPEELHDAALPSHVANTSKTSGASCSGAKSSGGVGGGSKTSGASCSDAILSGGASCSGATSADGASCSVMSDEARQSAESSLREETSINKLQALATAADILRKAGDVAMAQALDDRLLNLQKKKLQSSEPDRLFLRSKLLERQKTRSAAQAAAAADTRKLRLLEQEAKIQKAKADQQKGEARVEARKLEEAARVAARAAKSQSAATKLNLDLCRRHWVAQTLQLWIAFFSDAARGSQRREAVVKTVRAAKKRKAQYPVSPDPWSASKRAGYISIAPLTTTWGKRAKASKEIASESLAFLLYGGKHPSAATTCESVVSRADKLIDRSMPMYNDLFVGLFSSAQLLAKHKGNLDLALFEAMWRYSHLAGGTLQPALHAWPPTTAELDTFASKLQCAPASIPPPKQASAVSSSSSGHPPAKKAKHGGSCATWT